MQCLATSTLSRAGRRDDGMEKRAVKFCRWRCPKAGDNATRSLAADRRGYNGLRAFVIGALCTLILRTGDSADLVAALKLASACSSACAISQFGKIASALLVRACRMSHRRASNAGDIIGARCVMLRLGVG